MLAIVQTDVKPMLAVAIITRFYARWLGQVHATPARTAAGVPSVMVYMLAYAVLVVGTFAVVSRRPARRSPSTAWR